jgi:DNA polymerase
MSLSREQMLHEMGITPLWVLRDPVPAETAETMQEAPLGAQADFDDATATADAPIPEMQSTQVEHAAPTSGENRAKTAAPTVDHLGWPDLAKAVAECRACGLCQQRKQAVLGVGDLQPDWLFIGEGPGAEEDVKGEPFVGQAGKLLDAMLASIDLARDKKVYIANAVKCRPPGNRTPEAAEMATCHPYLARQIALLKPKVIVLLGKAAVHSVLQDDKPLGSLRGRQFEYAGIPVIVTYHPAYLLRNLPDKAKAWEDLLLARRTLAGRQDPALPF